MAFIRIVRCTVHTMSGIICLAHVLCAVLYVRCHKHLTHSSVDLGDLTHALFPILGESPIPQSSTPFLWGCYFVLTPAVVCSNIFLLSLIDSCWSTVSYFVLALFLLMPCVWLETPLGPSLVLAPTNGSFCDGIWGDASSNNLPNSLCQVSNNT